MHMGTSMLSQLQGLDPMICLDGYVVATGLLPAWVKHPSQLDMPWALAIVPSMVVSVT